MQDDRVQLFLKTIKVNISLDLKTQSVVTDTMLQDIIQICPYLHDPIIFQALYTFPFFSFLRLSNVLPHSMHSFDATRQLCMGDVIFNEVRATVLLKW